MDKTPQIDMFDAMLYAAAPHAGRRELEEYHAADPAMQLSARAKRRIVKRAKRGPTPILLYAKRVAMIALIVMSIGFAAMLSIEAVREAIVNAIVEWYEESIAVSFMREEEVVAPTEILEYREPRGLGEEFVRYEVRKSQSSMSIDYESDTVLIIYRQGLLESFDAYISNEESVMKDIQVNGYPGLITLTATEVGQQRTIVWHDNEYSYVITGNMSADELLKLAESVN
ncbi:MAG: DUF4367 domain-containing protein [Clostridia bacterium]|nr:DUF4367 domain-containing protein [Clostridia bacterium]